MFLTSNSFILSKFHFQSSLKKGLRLGGIVIILGIFTHWEGGKLINNSGNLQIWTLILLTDLRVQLHLAAKRWLMPFFAEKNWATVARFVSEKSLPTLVAMVGARRVVGVGTNGRREHSCSGSVWAHWSLPSLLSTAKFKYKYKYRCRNKHKYKYKHKYKHVYSCSVALHGDNGLSTSLLSTATSSAHTYQ